MSTVAELSPTFEQFVAAPFRPSQPGIVRCLRCEIKFKSDDVRTNRVCSMCQRVNRGACTRAAKLEKSDGRVVRKKLGSA